METQLIFQDPSRVTTPLLAVFAVDVTVGKQEEPLPALLRAPIELRAARAAQNRVTSA